MAPESVPKSATERRARRTTLDEYDVGDPGSDVLREMGEREKLRAEEAWEAVGYLGAALDSGDPAAARDAYGLALDIDDAALLDYDTFEVACAAYERGRKRWKVEHPKVRA
jgi:hypothetical protein